MATFFSYLKKHPLPSRTTVHVIVETGRTWYGALVYILCIALCVSLYAFVATLSMRYSVVVPKHGGKLIEGILGAPHTINPVLARTDIERGLSTLVYGGLVRIGSDGAILPGIASVQSVSPDNRIYTFVLDQGAVFSNKTPITSADVVFTFSLAKDPIVQAPDYEYWKDVVITAIDPQTVTVTLPEPRSDFLSHMTLGILSQAHWSSVTPETFETLDRTVSALGNGMFKLTEIDQDAGIPKRMHFVRNHHYSGNRPFVDEFSVVFFANQDLLAKALRRNTIDFTFSLTPESAAQFRTKKFITATLPTKVTTTLFRTSNDTMLGDTAFSKILSQAIARDQLVDIVTSGYSIPSTQDAPLPKEAVLQKIAPLGYSSVDGMLKKKGADVGFSIAVGDTETLRATARELARIFQDLGLLVTVESYDRGTFQDGVYRGIYAVFLTADAIPPKGAQAVIPLYSQSVPFVGTTETRGITTLGIYDAVDKYRHIDTWYKKTERIWNIFRK